MDVHQYEGIQMKNQNLAIKKSDVASQEEAVFWLASSTTDRLIDRGLNCLSTAAQANVMTQFLLAVLHIRLFTQLGHEVVCLLYKHRSALLIQ